jgi:hypothetical protein
MLDDLLLEGDEGKRFNDNQEEKSLSGTSQNVPGNNLYMKEHG